MFFQIHSFFYNTLLSSFTAAAGANYPRPGLMPRDPALALHPAELLGRPYSDMVHHEQLQRHLMMERERFPPHASLVAHHEEYLRFVL